MTSNNGNGNQGPVDNGQDSGHAGHDHAEHPGMAHDEEPGYYAVRARAMESLLVEKGICSPDEIQTMVDRIEARTPADGARVVAHAWSDPAYKSRLLNDPDTALAELGYRMPENSPKLDVVGKHRVGPLPGGLYPVLMLSPQPAGAAPGLVQEPGLPFSRRGGPPGCHAGIRSPGAGLNGGPGAGQYGRPALPGAAAAPRRYRGNDGGTTG